METWDCTLSFLERLNRRIDELDLAFSEGDHIKIYRIMRVIYRMIHWKIKQPGHDNLEQDLKKKFDNTKQNMENMMKGSSSKIGNSFQKLSLNRVEIILDETCLVLYDLLYDYGFIFPKGNGNER